MNRYLFPLISVWIIAAYIHLLHCLHILDRIPSKTVIFLLFLPVIPAEFLFSNLFSFGRLKKISEIDLRWFLLFSCRVSVWLTFFYVWVILTTHIAQEALWLKWFAPQFYSNFYLVFRGEGWLTLIALAVWLLCFHILTVRRRGFRMFTAMILPNALTLLLFIHLYYYGGAGGLFEYKILQQAGVQKVFDLKELDSQRQVNHPRGVCFEPKKNALLMMFGCTYCNDEVHYPTIVRKDLESEATQYFLSANIRRVYCNSYSDSIFVAPWYQEVFYELSKHNLKTVRTYPNQTEGLIRYWEPMDIFKDVSENRVYIANDVEQALLAYNLETGRIEKVLNLYKQGFVNFGGPLWNIVQSAKTRKLYFISGPGQNLYEADPDSLRILRHTGFFDGVGTALEIDDTKDLLYYQNGALNSLYEIDIHTFKTKRTLKGEIHARRIRLDKKRNALYVLGYFSGTVFAIDLDTAGRVWTIKVGGAPHGMDLKDDKLWISSMSGVFKLDIQRIWENAGHE